MSRRGRQEYGKYQLAYDCDFFAKGKNELSVLSKNSLEYRKNYKHVHMMCMKCYTLENLELAIAEKKNSILM